MKNHPTWVCVQIAFIIATCLLAVSMLAAVIGSFIEGLIQ